LPTPYLKANLEKNEGEIMKDKTLKIPNSLTADTCNIFFVTKTEYSYEKTFNRSNTFIFN